jgi:hypothetical protein
MHQLTVREMHTPSADLPWRSESEEVSSDNHKAYSLYTYRIKSHAGESKRSVAYGGGEECDTYFDKRSTNAEWFCSRECKKERARSCGTVTYDKKKEMDSMRRKISLEVATEQQGSSEEKQRTGKTTFYLQALRYAELLIKRTINGAYDTRPLVLSLLPPVSGVPNVSSSSSLRSICLDTIASLR